MNISQLELILSGKESIENIPLAKKDLEKIYLSYVFKNLWKNVVKQALLDASSNSNKRIIVASKKRLKDWFNLENKDFLMVCKLAGYEPSIIEYIYRKFKVDIKEKE